MRREVEWGSAVNFLEEQYQTDDIDVLQLTYDTLLEYKACLDKLLDNISEFTLTTNENITLAERSGERTTTLLKWKKIINGLSKSKMNTVGASGDNPITKTTMYAPSSKLYQTDTPGTKKCSPKSHGGTTYATDIIHLTTRENHHQIEVCATQSLYHSHKTHARH